MKNTFNYSFVIISLIIANSFFSCSTKKVGYFNNSYPSYSVKEKSSLPSSTVEATAQTNLQEGEDNHLAEIETPSYLPTIAPLNNPVPESGAKAKLSKEEKKEIRKFIKENLKNKDGNETDINVLLLVIIAILLPPVAVALVDGIGGPFFLSILLTLLFYVPGLIYALYRIFRTK